MTSPSTPSTLAKRLLQGSLLWVLSMSQSVAGPLQVPSPEWRDQVIYFVLTDRFDDGDPRNNDQGAGEYNPTDPSRFSGGDLRGIERRLHYIQQLGATAVWLTPPVANQWYSRKVNYGGYHGYWALDFKAIDAHLGSLEDYQRLSRALHGRGMYLVQDIVLNHTGNFFGYEGTYNAQQPADNFVLFEDAQSAQAKPSQYPFDQIDVRDPQQAAVAAYHFTPPIQDPTRPGEETRYKVGQLADINTSNPLVRQVLKDSYRYWLEHVGVDAYRIDTAKYVEHEFWHDFLHAPDGVLAKARQLGKQQFLAFGEVFDGSKPFEDSGERKLLSFLGSKQQPELNSVIAFPLYFELNKVLAEGQAPAQLADRIQKHLTLFPEPGLLPTFLNNHDTKRFLSAGSEEAFVQGYAVLFTIPGIPVIYQGDEQLLPETRQAMFAGGYGSTQDQFNMQSAMYQRIASLAQLRKAHSATRYGQFQPLQADSQAAGIFAYQLQDANERVLVVMNTADTPRLVSGLAVTADAQSLPVLWQFGTALNGIDTNERGELTLQLPARAVLVLQAPRLQQPLLSQALSTLRLRDGIPAELTRDLTVQGQGAAPHALLQVALNGDLTALPPLQADAQGQFSLTLPVRDLGVQRNNLVLFDAKSQHSSPVYSYQTRQDQAQWQASVSDAADDDKGPTGQYLQPTQMHSQRQLDIRQVQARAGGSVLELTLTMAQVSQFWAPANGFDNVHFSLYFDVPALKSRAQLAQLPGLQTVFPAGGRWQLGHQLFGWGNSVFTADGATAQQTGRKLGAAPSLRVDVARGQIHIRYQGSALGVHDWAGTQIYISTWDKTGEGALRQIGLAPSPWNFGGASPQSPKILDDLLLTLPQ